MTNPLLPSFRACVFLARALFLCLALSATVLPLAGADLELIAKDREPAVIILSAQAASPERYAAVELQRGIELATGVKLPIQSEATDPRKPAIQIGSITTRPELVEAFPSLAQSSPKEDEIAIWRKENVVYLSGSNPRSALYATYHFLETFLDFRWLWPGEDGEFYTPSERLVVGDLSIREKAGIQYRSFGINSPHYNEETLVWMSRNRMNFYSISPRSSQDKLENLHEKGFLARVSGHNLALPRELLEANPEWIAEFGGERRMVTKRLPHLCWSNKGVQEALKELFRSWLAHHPLVDIWSFYPVDHTHFCQCEACLEMAPDVSTRYQKLSAILINAVRKDYPDAMFSTLAYQAYQTPPNGFVAPFDFIQYAAYNVSYRHSLKTNHPSNEGALDDIKKWQELGAKMGWRGYEMIPFSEHQFVPLVSYIVDQVAYAREAGLNTMYTEVTPSGHPASLPREKRNWDTNRMNLYAEARACWNPEISAKQIVKDWTKRIYGAAAEPMQQYYFLMEKAWQSAPSNISYFHNAPAAYTRGFLTDGLIAKCEQALAQGRKLLAAGKQDHQRALQQVAFEETMFKQWKTLYDYLDTNRARYQAAVPHAEASEEALMDAGAKAWEEATQLPEFEAIHSQKINDQTDVALLWTNDTLFLRLTCHDSIPNERKARFTQHDDTLWSDDSIEIFLNNPGDDGYGHLIVNSLNTRYDAASKGGMSLDRRWNPRWNSRVSLTEKAWVTVIALPLKEFGYASAAGAEVNLSIKRTRSRGSEKGYPNSGWPNAAYHSTGNHGTLKLVAGTAKSVLLYGGEAISNDMLNVLFRQKGWAVTPLLKGEAFGEMVLDAYDVIYMRYGDGQHFQLSPEVLQQNVLPYLHQGGTVIFSASRPIPLDRWLSGEEFGVKWSGWDISVSRRAIFVKKGAWLVRPQSIEKVVHGGLTPSSGFFPLSPAWETLATLLLKDGREVPFLIRQEVGSGQLILTSSNMGYGGGREMFGSRNPANVVQLIENLTNL